MQNCLDKFKSREMSFMNFTYYAHRYAHAIIASDPVLANRYNEFLGTLVGITDNDLINDFINKKAEYAARGTNFKSISHSINSILKERMEIIPGWGSEVDIFNDTTGVIGNTQWRLDFACDNGLAIEVAFNHGEAIAWNLIKPCLSSELNHVQKAFQTRVGVYVCATDAMKVAGNFDSASGSYEKVLRYLPPMMNQLTTPMIIIGITPPNTFRIDKRTKDIVMI